MPSHRNRFVDEAIAAYSAERTSVPSRLALELEATTLKVAGDASRMQIGHDQATLLEILARAIGARNAVEVGTFTGYSALAIATGMGAEGKLLCCDISEEWTSVARDIWDKAGVQDRITLSIGPATETLASLSDAGEFDLAFIDADKTGYSNYFKLLVPRLRLGGLLLADNTLQSGRVIDPSANEADVVAIRAFNEMVLADPRVKVVLLPFGDGVTVAQRIA